MIKEQVVNVKKVSVTIKLDSALISDVKSKSDYSRPPPDVKSESGSPPAPPDDDESESSSPPAPPDDDKSQSSSPPAPPDVQSESGSGSHPAPPKKKRRYTNSGIGLHRDGRRGKQTANRGLAPVKQTSNPTPPTKTQVALKRNSNLKRSNDRKELRVNVLEGEVKKLDIDLSAAEKLLNNHEQDLNMIGKSCNDKIAKADKEVGKHRDRLAKNQIVFAVASEKSKQKHEKQMKVVKGLAAAKHEKLEEKHEGAEVAATVAAESATVAAYAAMVESTKLHNADVKKKMEAATAMYVKLQQKHDAAEAAMEAAVAKNKKL